MNAIEKLNNIGCNTKEGLERCLNKADFFLKLLKMAVADNKVYELKDSINNKDFDKAFSISHTLKGVYANLAITPLYNLFYTLTEELRAKENKDYTNEINEIISLFEKVKEIVLE